MQMYESDSGNDLGFIYVFLTSNEGIWITFDYYSFGTEPNVIYHEEMYFIKVQLCRF